MNQALLDIRDLCVRFPGQKSYAIDQLNLQIQHGRSVGLVGSSGAGKSSVARAIMQLIHPESGDIRFNGQSVLEMDTTQLGNYRRNVQMIFQEPSASLSPRRTIEATLLEPLLHFNIGNRESQNAKIRSTLKTVGLDTAALQRFPHQFSSGQQQRIAIARALVTDPGLLIADEAVSALDVSVQAQILELLQSLQSDLGITLLFISHDLAVINQVVDEVAVMYRGQLLEHCPTGHFFTGPSHPYSRALLSFATMDVSASMANLQWRLQTGRDAAGARESCLFSEHCDERMDICSNTEPQLRQVAGEKTGRSGLHCVKCHLYPDTENS